MSKYLTKKEKAKFKRTVKFLKTKSVRDFHISRLSYLNWNPLRIMLYLEKRGML